MTKPSRALIILKQLLDEGINDDDSLYIVYWASGKKTYPIQFYKNIDHLRKRFRSAFVEKLPRAIIIRGRFVALAVLKLARAFNLNPKIYRLEEVREE